MHAVLAWNTIFDAINNRAINPVSRNWAASSGWVLFDWDDYEKINDFKAIVSHCNKCDDKKKNPDDGSNAEQSKDDLFEFDF